MLENGADLHVNERQKIRHYRARSTEGRRIRRRRRRIKKKKERKKEEECQITIFFTRFVRKLALYSDVIHLFDWKSAVEHDGGV